MKSFTRHGLRFAIALVPLVFALLHSIGVLPIPVVERLDSIIYDARLRWTMPRAFDERIVIVDVMTRGWRNRPLPRAHKPGFRRRRTPP